MSENKTFFRLDGKVALVTGGSRGLGASIARALAQAGAKVLVTDILEEEGRVVVDDIRRSGGEAMFSVLDVTDEKDWDSGIHFATDRLGGLDILVNNAGIEITKLIKDTPLDDWRRLHAVNLEGVFLGTRSGIRAMMPGGSAGKGGTIINMSSIAGLRGYAGFAGYCSTKAAVRNFTKAAAVECARLGFNVRVNSVHPGIIKSEMMERFLGNFGGLFFEGDKEKSTEYVKGLIPMGCFGEPTDVAAAVLFLASDAARYVTGSELVTDGGITAS